MPKYINDIITKKDAERKERSDAAREKKLSKYHQLMKELDQTKKSRLRKINLIHQIICAVR
jgi:hypothetical protein